MSRCKSCCKSCCYRADFCIGGPERPGCNYLLITGKSRLKAAYELLGVDSITDAVREILRPARCRHYRKGTKLPLPYDGQILLPGSITIRKRLDKVRAAELYAKGLNDKEISKELGCSRETVQRWRVSQGLPHNFKQGKEARDGAV